MILLSVTIASGDDIGRGQPTDKSSEMEAHEKTMRAIIWGVSASFLLIFVVVLATVLMVCQYHRLVFKMTYCSAK